MKRKLIAALSVSFTATLFHVTCLADDQTPTGVTFSAGAGYYHYDSERNLDDDALGAVSIGYQFASPWALELLYLNADTEAEHNGGDVDVDQWRLDALYHFNRQGNWQPYGAVGAGVMSTEPVGSDHDESIINAGGGVKYFLTPALSLRSDLRLINSLDNEMNDVALTLGVHYFMGKPAHTPTPASRELADTDNDSVKDDMDNCLNTAAGVAVDAYGCALDDDHDGVANTFDQCPGSTMGAKVDENGCYVMLTKMHEVQLSINFANNSPVVQQADYAEIETIATFMTQFPQTKVVIEGHTDDRGNADYNQQLSERRARAVAQVLVDQFSISANRVSAVGYGEQRPIVSNDTPANRAQNRRVVAVVQATTRTIQK